MNRASELIKQFLYYSNPMDKKWGIEGSFRWPTFKAALSLFLQRDGETIVETGCCHFPNDWGAGRSTEIFDEFCKTYGGQLFTVDINPANIQACRDLVGETANTTFTVSDSVQYLDNFTISRPSIKTIDLLYLDSYDYPIVEIADTYLPREKHVEAMGIIWKLSEKEFLQKHGTFVSDSQQHCLKELMAAQPYLGEQTVILIDDSNLPGGGKPRLAKEWLYDNGWVCPLELSQSLWVRK